MSEAAAVGSAAGSHREFWSTPVRVRIYLATVAVAAVALPIVFRHHGVHVPAHPEWLTAIVLVVISVLNVEIGRALAGGLSESHQPHKSLSAWAFACALLLSPLWLLLIVPLTYAHTRWRGLRVPLWKWVWSALFLILCGLTAALVADALYGDGNWMLDNGGRGVVAIAAAAVAFLAVEVALFAGIAYLNVAEDEVWLRQTLRSPSYYFTETGVLLIGGLLSAVWTGGGWFVLLFLPVYTLAQRAVLHEPLRERAEAAAQLAETNTELERANEFKADLMGMLGHEIGNPLTSVVGYAQVGAEALAEGDSETARRSLGIVDRKAEQIRLVLHDILSLVSSERGALVAHPEACLLEPHLRSAVTARPDLPAPVVECPSELAVLVQPGHLDQMLANLLSNAHKYAGGPTRLAACVVDDRVEIHVADGGPGIPEKLRDRLFERFSRGTDTAGTVSGTGLGLFITRELARANGGEVTFRDCDPTGSVFVLTLSRPG
ncbi:MAG: sensor histidine kinase [Nocardioides sp.]